MSDVLLELESRPGNPKSKRLRMTTTDVTIGTDQFRWDDIDRISYAANVHIVNGADMGATFVIALGNSGRNARFALDSRTTGVARINRHYDIREQQHGQWAAAVTLIEERVSRRLIDQVIAALGRGENVTLGRLNLDQHGIRKGGLFAKSVAWQDISTTLLFDGYFLIFKHGSEKRPAIKVSHGAWNVVLLPHIIEVMASR